MYAIQCYDRNCVGQVFRALQAGIQEDGRFTVRNFLTQEVKVSREDRAMMGQGKVYSLPAIILKGVRLTHKKPYCGQHAHQECPVGRRKPNARICEWNDWIDFHALVNGVLDKMSIAANVWTNPTETLDHGGKMWIRRGMKPRVRWDWEGHTNNYGRVEEVWNHGDDSQFIP